MSPQAVGVIYQSSTTAMGSCALVQPPMEEPDFNQWGWRLPPETALVAARPSHRQQDCPA